MTWEEEIFAAHVGKRVLVDSNLLLLFLVGSFERERISLFKRTSTYSVADYNLLVDLLSQFSTIVTTPHILTEVGNLANSLPDHIRRSWTAHFALQISRLEEIFDDAVSLAQESSFILFGLTDTAIARVSRDTLVLTEDWRLTGYLRSRGLPVLNFVDLRHVALAYRMSL